MQEDSREVELHYRQGETDDCAVSIKKSSKTSKFAEIIVTNFNIVKGRAAT